MKKQIFQTEKGEGLDAQTGFAQIFASWWFWGLVILYALITIGSTEFIGSTECIGIFLGSVIVITMYVSTGWGVYWIGKKISKKIKDR